MAPSGYTAANGLIFVGLYDPNSNTAPLDIAGSGTINTMTNQVCFAGKTLNPNIRLLVATDDLV